MPGTEGIPPWGGRRVQAAREWLATTLPRPCSKCGATVWAWQRWELDHIRDRDTYPELTWEPSNWAAAHRRCNRAGGAHIANRKRGERQPAAPAQWTAPGW